jgi:hypothetical protein
MLSSHSGEKPSDLILALVEGLPSPNRQRRPLMILRSYIDDSDINQGAFSILAGWIGPADRWAMFADDWQAALTMRNLKRFKMSEFLRGGGEFFEWSEDEKSFFIKYLMNLIRERAFKGIAIILPSDVYSMVFKKVMRPFNIPYSVLLFSLVSNTIQRFDYPDVDRIDFVFDIQNGQSKYIIDQWDIFKRSAPDRLKSRLGDPPIFRSDETTLPLQAADLYAGWVRRIAPFLSAGKVPPSPPWVDQEQTLDSYVDYFTAEGLIGAYAALFGKHP